MILSTKRTKRHMVANYGKLLGKSDVESREQIGVDQHEQFATLVRFADRRGEIPLPRDLWQLSC
jgi:hypothetical protein